MNNFIKIGDKKIKLSDKQVKEFLEAQEPKELTYEDVAKELFLRRKTYFPTSSGDIVCTTQGCDMNGSIQNNNATSKEQLEAILALNKLCNVAKYLNGDWKRDGDGYFIYIGEWGEAHTWYGSGYVYSAPYFKSEALAKQAISILGEEEIKKALTLNV